MSGDRVVHIHLTDTQFYDLFIVLGIAAAQSLDCGDQEFQGRVIALIEALNDTADWQTR